MGKHKKKRSAVKKSLKIEKLAKHILTFAAFVVGLAVSRSSSCGQQIIWRSIYSATV